MSKKGKTNLRRKRNKAASGRVRKRKNDNKGSTPKFPIHKD